MKATILIVLILVCNLCLAANTNCKTTHISEIKTQKIPANGPE